MSPWIIILDVVVLLGAALMVGGLAERLRQNAIVGYLITGVLLGPSGFAFVQGVPEIQAVSELGVALLLFAIGLEFSLTRLRQLGTVAWLGGTAQLVLTAALAGAASSLLGLGLPEALAVGAAISVSSTAVVMRVLVDRAELESRHGRTALGILLLQDLAVIPLGLAIIAAGKGRGGAEALGELLRNVGLALLFILVSYVVVRYILPGMFQRVSALRNRDLPVVLAVFVALGTAWLSHALGLSPILGAFIGGLLLAESPFAVQIRADVGPLRAILVTLFFASIGLAVNLPTGQGFLHVVLLAAATFVLKAAVVTGIITAFRQGFRNAAATGITLAQTGEFSFVLLDLGLTENVIARPTFELLAASSVLTLVATPYLISLASRLEELARGVTDQWERKQVGPSHEGEDAVIIVGYGPAGREAADALQAAHIPFLVLELNSKTVEACRTTIPIEVGDATQAEILEHFGLSRALVLVVTIPDPRTSQIIIRQAKRLAPHVPIVARARYHQHAPALIGAGANIIIDEEALVGESIGSSVLGTLGSRSAKPNDSA